LAANESDFRLRPPRDAGSAGARARIEYKARRRSSIGPFTNTQFDKGEFPMKREIACAFGLVFALATAGASAAEPPAAKPEAAPAAGAPTPAKIDWEKMDKKQRKEYMKKTVLPEMKKAFVEFDAKRYKKMSCATCHGDGATKGDFKMPNPQLPKLPTDQKGFQELQQKKPEAVKFMGTKVKPQMAALLGMPEWTPQNTNGFGCYQCHTKQGEAAAKPAK
jgi:hypothetical protein